MEYSQVTIKSQYRFMKNSSSFIISLKSRVTEVIATLVVNYEAPFAHASDVREELRQ
jgi:hypothetical protein